MFAPAVAFGLLKVGLHLVAGVPGQKESPRRRVVGGDADEALVVVAGPEIGEASRADVCGVLDVQPPCGRGLKLEFT